MKRRGDDQARDADGRRCGNTAAIEEGDDGDVHPRTQLEAAKDPAERNADAQKQMGAAGLEIARGLNTGKISSQEFENQVAVDANTVTQAMANMAAAVEQSLNKIQTDFENARRALGTGSLLPTPAGGKGPMRPGRPGICERRHDTRARNGDE